MTEKRQINVQIDNGCDVFHGDFITIAHKQGEVLFDFRQATPRFNPGPGGQNAQNIVIKHNVVSMNPILAKNFLQILKRNIENYEKKFGKINVPKEKKAQSKKEPEEMSMDMTPSYFG